MPLTLPPDASTPLTVLFAVTVAFVLAVLVATIAQAARSRRRILLITCAENHGRVVVIVRPWATGAAPDAIAHCSRWHKGRLDCGERCLDSLAADYSRRHRAGCWRRRIGSC